MTNIKVLKEVIQKLTLDLELLKQENEGLKNSLKKQESQGKVLISNY